MKAEDEANEKLQLKKTDEEEDQGNEEDQKEEYEQNESRRSIARERSKK
jgi:hypothetical protein